MCHSVWGGVGFPACITGHLTRGSASRRGFASRVICILGGSASRGRSASRGQGESAFRRDGGLHRGGGGCLPPGGMHLGGLHLRGLHPGGPTSKVGWADPSIGYYGIQSTSRRYASYWNTLLFVMDLLHFPCHYRAR